MNDAPGGADVAGENIAALVRAREPRAYHKLTRHRLLPLTLLLTSYQRERSRSPRRRSRSPERSRRRSYSPRSRSHSREDRPGRSRSPMTGAGEPSGGSNSGYGGQPPNRSYEDRSRAREQMMNNIRETSQQDRRVYVGNLSYDVKWHHLKDFMRQGEAIGRHGGVALG